MKNNYFIIFLFIAIQAVQSQEASVERSIFEIQTGLLGVWGTNETKLSNEIALRTEIGFDAGFVISSNHNNYYSLAPTIKIEPRWYYNLKRRKSKSKNITGNSGNFLSLKTTYRPDWFVISNENVKVNDHVLLTLNWGIKRSLGKHFTYETGFGVGYGHDFETGYGRFLPNLQLRIGYRF